MIIEKPPQDWRDSADTIIQMGHYCKRLRDENPNHEIGDLLIVDCGVNESTAKKLIHISIHPILGNPEHASKLPASWALLYEAKFLPDNILLEKMDSGEIKKANKYQIWDWRGIKTRGTPANILGRKLSKVNVPENISLVAYVSAGMQRENEFGGDCGNAGDVAKLLQIGVATYHMVRSILILARRADLNPKDRELVNSTIDKINKSRNVRTHYEKVKPLIDKIWGNSQSKVLSKKLSQKRVDGYMDSVAILTEMCRSLYEREQPYLPSADIDRAILDLTEASRIIRALAENLRRTKSE